MTPKFLQLLETCIFDGVVLGHKRAYKHNDAPSEADINQSIVNEVMNELHDWFDFDDDDDTQDWVSLTKKEVLAISKINMDIIDMIYFVEAKVREKNHG